MTLQELRNKLADEMFNEHEGDDFTRSQRIGWNAAMRSVIGRLDALLQARETVERSGAVEGALLDGAGTL